MDTLVLSNYNLLLGKYLICPQLKWRRQKNTGDTDEIKKFARLLIYS